MVAELVREKKEKAGKNVLCLGMWNAKSANVNGVDGMLGVECAWPNSALNILRGLSWQLLHERIGSDLLRFVVKEMLVFSRIQNNCYLQLCGTSVSFLLKKIGNKRHHLEATLLTNNKTHLKALGKIPFSSGVEEPPPKHDNLHDDRGGKAAKHVVRRAPIFYDDRFVKNAGFAPSHVLSHKTCRPVASFARHLCRVIFQNNRNHENFNNNNGKNHSSQRGRLHTRYRGLVKPLIQLVHRHLKMKYGFFLRIYCPMPNFKKEVGDEIVLEDIIGADLSYKQLIGHHIEPFQIFKFVWTIIYRLVPLSIWGDDGNRRLGREMVHQFIQLRRYEDFNLEVYLAKFRMSQCAWIPRSSSPSRFEANKTMVASLLKWIVGDLVVPLLRNHFYITESAVHRNKVFYYRKPLWKQIVAADLGRDTQYVKDMFRMLPENEALVLRENDFKLPTSQLRLLPKASGMRLIGNLSVRNLDTDGKRNSANFLLRPVFEVLKWELFGNGKESYLGSSVFSLGDAHEKLLPFIQQVRAQKSRSQQHQQQQKLYFVSVDVKGSFDSVNQKKLCHILFENREEPIFSHEKYVIQKFLVHLPCVGHLATSFKSMAAPAHMLKPLHVSLAENHNSDAKYKINLRNSVLIDNANCEMVDRQHAEKLLRHHIVNNVIYLNGRYYKQEVGIPQGSVLSSLLCSLFYGHMERHGLQDLPIYFNADAAAR